MCVEDKQVWFGRTTSIDFEVGATSCNKGLGDVEVGTVQKW